MLNTIKTAFPYPFTRITNIFKNFNWGSFILLFPITKLEMQTVASYRFSHIYWYIHVQDHRCPCFPTHY